MSTNNNEKSFLKGKALQFGNIIPEEVKLLIKTLQNHNKEVYIVGGAIRNFLLNYPIKEYDIATNALPDEIIEWLSQKSVKTRKTGSKYGTVLAVIGKKAFDISTFRSEHFKIYGEPPVVTFEDNLDKDLARRDFRINSIAYDPNNEIFIDKYNGIRDIKQKKIRFIGEPSRRLNEDGLRIIRLARFISEYNLSVDPYEKDEIIKSRLNMPFLRYKALKKEFFKLLRLEDYSKGLFLLLETFMLNVIFQPLFNLVSENEIANAKNAVYKLSEISLQSEITKLFGLIVLTNDFSAIKNEHWFMVKKKLNLSLKQKELFDRILNSWIACPKNPDYKILKTWIRKTGINTSEDLLKLKFLDAELRNETKFLRHKSKILDEANKILVSFRHGNT